MLLARALLLGMTLVVLSLTACGAPTSDKAPAAASASPTACPSAPPSSSPRPRPSGTPGTPGTPGSPGFPGRGAAPAASGTVTAVKAGGRLTVEDRRAGTAVEVVTNGSTEVRVNGAAGKLSDIKIGTNVVVTGTRQPDGSVLAAGIQVVARNGCPGGRRPRPSGSPTGTTQ